MKEKIIAKIAEIEGHIEWLEKKNWKDREEIAEIAKTAAYCDREALDRITTRMNAIREREAEKEKGLAIINELKDLME